MSDQKRTLFSRLATIFIILGPVVDVFTSLSEKFLSIPLSLGILVRFAFVGLIGIYLLFIYKDKHHILIKVFFLIVSAYGIAHILLNAYVFGSSTLFENLKMFFKTYYFVYTLLFFFALYRSEGFKISDRILSIVFLEYTVCILVAVLTKTSFMTYPHNWAKGYCGWFFAGNEVAAVVAGLAFVAVYYAAYRANIFVGIAIMLLTAFAGTYIGTKVAFIAIVGAVAVSLLHYAFSALLRKDGATKALLKTAVAVLALIVLFVANSPIKQNVTTLTTDRFDNAVTDNLTSSDALDSSDISSSSETDTSSEDTSSQEPDDTDDAPQISSPGKMYYIMNWLLSGRLDHSKTAFATFGSCGIENKVMGLGYNFLSPDGRVVKKALEMDFLTLIINNGILGFILYMAPLVAFAVICIKKFFKNIKYFFNMQDIVGYICAILILLFCAALSGHILIAPAVSVYLAIIIINLFAALEEKTFIETK